MSANGPTPGRRHRVEVDVRTVLLIGAISLTTVIALPAWGHSLAPCNSHGRELSKLLTEKAEMGKEALLRTQKLLELKQDLAVKEIMFYLEEGYEFIVRMKEANDILEESNLIVEVKDRNIQRRQEHLEQQTQKLISFYGDVLAFDSTGPTRALITWMNCLADLRKQHLDRVEWPPGYEEMPLLLEEMRAFQSR